MGLPAHKKRIIPHHRIMRKKHLKIKLLKFQRFRDGVCFDDLNRTLHLARPSVKISGYLLSFRLKRQKNRKNRHFMHRQLAQAASTPQPAPISSNTKMKISIYPPLSFFVVM